MSASAYPFTPEQPLVTGYAGERCRAVVVVPARNEEASLAATLGALAGQRDVQGAPLAPELYEVILLLNNCTDRSAEVVRAWQVAAHGGLNLHVVETGLPPEHAHVGTARRLLMDTAWSRLQRASGPHAAGCGILSTDSDTIVAPDWVAQNLRALGAGADAVGGVIELKTGELEALPEGARAAYLADREFQLLFAALEDRLDPQTADPWPRHREHFGASLACTPAVYERAGGLPPVNPLEDMAFVDRLFRIDARLRHEPAVRVFTSARFDGRASVGLSWQLRTWQHMYDAGEPHRVPCADWLQHRFRSLRGLRALHRSGAGADVSQFAAGWQERVREALHAGLTTGEFLARIDCNAWIAETYAGPTREAEISRVVSDLRSLIPQGGKPQRNRVSRTQKRSLSEVPIPARAAAGPSGSGQLDVR